MNRKNQNRENLFIVALVILVISHGAFNLYFSNLVINFTSLILVVLILFFHFIQLRRIYSLILVIYICTHFSFLEARGGIFPIAITVLVFLCFFFKEKIIENRINDPLLNFGLIIFILSNILGWLTKNDMQFDLKIMGILALFGYIFIFWITSSISWSINRIEKLLIVFATMSIYNLFISLNQIIGLIKIEITPLIPVLIKKFDDPFSYGTFGHSELFGEYGLVNFIIFLTILTSAISKNLNKKTRIVSFLGLLSSVLNIFLSFARSVFALLILFLIIYITFIYLANRKLYQRKIQLLFYFATVALILFVLWKPLNIGFIFDRFLNENLAAKIEVSPSMNIITGEGTPRQLAFSYFLMRYPQESWWIGYGWGVTKSNRIAWFNDPETPRADYHSLYLSIIMLYGWIGAAVFVSFCLLIIYRLIKVNLKKGTNVVFSPLSLSFLLSMIFILIDQYKTSLLRETTFHMIFWIWLGLSYSIYYDFKKIKI